MNRMDYDCALFFTHRSQWDDLLILMVRTNDDFLAKKIECFLHAYHFAHDGSILEQQLYLLLTYINHAIDATDAHLDGMYIATLT